MALIENPICKCGEDMTPIPLKTKVKLEPLAFCETCDPNVIKYWNSQRKQIEP